MDSEMNIYNLHKRHDNRRVARENYYKDILKKCWNRINMVSSLHSYTTTCVFKIPEFVFGIPPHDLNECSDYIYNSLTTSGFRVERNEDKKIFQISWDKKYLTNFVNNISELENKKEVNKTKNTKPKQKVGKNNYKGIDEYKPTGTFLYDNMWGDIDRNNKLLFSD